MPPMALISKFDKHKYKRIKCQMSAVHFSKKSAITMVIYLKLIICIIQLINDIK